MYSRVFQISSLFEFWVLLFILCTNVVKSWKDKINFTKEIQWKIGNIKFWILNRKFWKNQNRTFKLNFSCSSFYEWVSGMALTWNNSKHFALMCPIPPLSRGSTGVKMGILEHFTPFWPPKKSWREKHWAKCFEFVLRHVRAIPETDPEWNWVKLSLTLRPGGPWVKY